MKSIPLNITVQIAPSDCLGNPVGTKRTLEQVIREGDWNKPGSHMEASQARSNSIFNNQHNGGGAI
jgi:hypothetical protein